VREFRFILGRRALIVFLALLIATGALLGLPAATRTLAGTLADVWKELPLVTPAAPAPSQFIAMAATPSGDVLLFASYSSEEGRYCETWIFNTNTNTWGLLDTGSSSPTARQGHAMATLPGIGVLLFGGDGGEAQYLGDTWLFTYDGTGTGTWADLTPNTSPTARMYHAMASTPSGVLLFGGLASVKPPTSNGTGGYLNYVGIPLGDTWQFNTITGTWGLLATGSPSPVARLGHGMAALPLSATPSGVLLFGGVLDTITPDYTGNYLQNGVYTTDDTWLFNTSTASWTQLSTSPTPVARYYLAMASTPSGVLLFGGDDGEEDSILGDTWLYGPATPPPPAGMPGLSPWALALLSVSLLGAAGWWFLRRRRIGDG